MPLFVKFWLLGYVLPLAHSGNIHSNLFDDSHRWRFRTVRGISMPMVNTTSQAG